MINFTNKEDVQSVRSCLLIRDALMSWVHKNDSIDCKKLLQFGKNVQNLKGGMSFIRIKHAIHLVSVSVHLLGCSRYFLENLLKFLSKKFTTILFNDILKDFSIIFILYIWIWYDCLQALDYKCNLYINVVLIISRIQRILQVCKNLFSTYFLIFCKIFPKKHEIFMWIRLRFVLNFSSHYFHSY